jgi:hypothetical protein
MDHGPVHDGPELQSAPVFTYVLIDIPDLHHTQVPGLLQHQD